MTRDEAMAVLIKIRDKQKIGHTDDYHELQLKIFEALGMLKFDKPMTKREQFEKALISDGFYVAAIISLYDKVHRHD
jgi:hypothetical protein